MTIDELLKDLSRNAFIEGTNNVMPLNESSSNETGAFLRGVRESQLGVCRYLFPANNSNYYLGSILVADNNFRSSMPKRIILREDERKPLTIVPSLYYKGLESEQGSMGSCIPTESNMNIYRNKFVNTYKSKLTESNYAPSNTIIRSYSFDTTDGISIGGSIKGVDLGFNSGNTTRKVKVFEIKQILYSMSIGDTYRNASDFFTNNLDINAFSNGITTNGTRYSPAYIETIYYGKVAYLAIASTDQKAMDASIGIQGNKLTTNFGKSFKRCEFSAIIRGGQSGQLNSYGKSLNYDSADDFINLLNQELTSNNADTAVPVEFEACYLANPSQNVETNIFPYYQTYVNQIRLRIVDNNTGASFGGIVRYLEPQIDRKGIKNFVLRRVGKKSIGFDIMLSPLSVCIELKVDIVGASDSRDYNVFVPYIPLELLTPDSDGIYTFRMILKGNTIFNCSTTFNPTLPGCYSSGNNQVYMANGSLKGAERGIMCDEASYSGKTEKECVREFFRWCEFWRIKKASFRCITSEKLDKSGNR